MQLHSNFIRKQVGVYGLNNRNSSGYLIFINDRLSEGSIWPICKLNPIKCLTRNDFYSFFVNNLRKPIALGGRYDSYKYNDNITRKATGFSIDLKDIITTHEK